jgi:hypothetical protein
MELPKNTYYHNGALINTKRIAPKENIENLKEKIIKLEKELNKKEAELKKAYEHIDKLNNNQITK